MQKIEIYYSPYRPSTRLFTDGNERSQKGRRVNEFIVGRAIENWLTPYVFSYQKWNGILQELMDDLNDDELQIYFYSLTEYSIMFHDELKRQSAVLEKGFAADLWTYTFIEKFQPKEIQGRLVEFIGTVRKFAPNQRSLEIFDFANLELNRNLLTVEDIQMIYKNLLDGFGVAEKFCDKFKPAGISRWKKARNELERIFEGD